GWLTTFVEHRIADDRVLRHVRKWLNAGVMEAGQRTEQEAGVPQGGSISPLLANLYLHYALDLWADQWRTRHAGGDVVIVRYADDFVVGFERQSDAERFLADLRERFRRFNLALHDEKTRVIEFGRFARQDREKRKGKGGGVGGGKRAAAAKPASFHFLGLTHSCGRTRRG